MKTLIRIPKLFRLLLLLGFIQAVTADSHALPTRVREPVSQVNVSGDPPGGADFPAPLELLTGALPGDLSCAPPVEVVRVLKVPWRLLAPGCRVDRYNFTGLSPPVVLSRSTSAC